MFEYGNRTGTIPIDFRDIIYLLVYSSLYLSFAGAAMVWISCVLQGLAFDPTAAAIAVLVTFSIYNLNRKTDESEDAINHAERYAFTKKYGKFLFYSAIAAYGVALLLSIIQGFDSLLITAIPLIGGVVYSIPLLPTRTGFIRLKEIPVMKSLIVAIAWAVPPALLPICHAGLHADLSTAVVGIFYFSLVFINTVVFDMRDVEGDTASGVRTIPVILGMRTTKIVLTVLNVCFGAAIVYGGLAFMGLPVTLMLIASVVYAQWYILSFHRLCTEKILCELLADGQFILLCGVLYVIVGLIPVSLP
jgi:4-hydroxybenzoate polyprenyltransferase